MCGIVGIVHTDPSSPVDRAFVRRMCDMIRHRGPDDEGIHIGDGAGLGARRLSIIDIQGGHQPMSTLGGAQAIAFNGEIYNYRALRAALNARGYKHRTNCDTETVLNACVEYGTDAPKHLRGMFAFAMWDNARRELLLARDRFGMKPLYYGIRPWGIAFASELKVFARCGLTSRDVDADALDAYLELGYIPAPLSPFGDVRKLEPGHVLRWKDGRVEISRYWDLPAASPNAPADPRAVRAWFDDSVAAHLVSDVPIAAFLSGGIDSSSVVASASLQQAPPHAFVAQYHGTGAVHSDETSLARALADRYGASLTVVDIRPDIAATFERIVEALDEPHADDSAIPTWTLAQAVGRQYKVALTGTGGDELFAGYRRHFGVVWSGWYGRLPRLLRRAIAGATGVLRDSEGGRGVYRLRRFAEGGDGDASTRMLSFVSRLRDHERANLYAAAKLPASMGSAARLFRDHLADSKITQDPLRSAQFLDYRTFLTDDILALSDRISMAHGLELRTPFVDHEFVDRVFPIASSRKAGWGSPKRLLRRAMRDRLPAAHFSAPKRGFVGPTGAWLRNELRPMLEGELSMFRMARLGYFDPGVVHRLIQDHMSRRHDREGILWAMLCFSTWHRVFVESASGPIQDGIARDNAGTVFTDSTP
jgi:asparagine synthase (glutamine-hydrolysing)